MGFGVIVLSILILAWLRLRSTRNEVLPDSEAWRAQPRRLSRALGLLAIVIAQAPIARLTGILSDLPSSTPGDVRVHARIAAELARSGAVHGWTDAFQAGIPIGPHYPVVGWLLAAVPIRLGLAPELAFEWIGLLGVGSVGVLTYGLAVRSRAHVESALLTACAISWVASSSAYVGGYRAFFHAGVVNQVVCLPLLVWLTASVVSATRRTAVVVPAALAMLAHPQVTSGWILVAALPVVTVWRKPVLARYCIAVAAAGMLGLGVYGPGLTALDVPFGWPERMGWLQFGFGPSRLVWWLWDGDLLDHERAPVLTTLWAGSLVLAALRLRNPLCRAALVASVTVMALAVLGPFVAGLGWVGRVVMSFYQPMRILSIIPLVMTFAVLVATEEGLALASSILRATWPRFAKLERGTVSAALGGLVLAVVVANTVPDRLRWVSNQRDFVLDHTEPSPCGARTPQGFDLTVVRSWLAALQHGRLWYDDAQGAPLEGCFFTTSLELAPTVPVAVMLGGPAVAGVHTAAFHRLRPDRPGSARRAEALGIRHVLAVDSKPVGPGWKTVASSGSVALVRRTSGSDIVGCSCVVSSWSGAEDQLRSELYAWLADPTKADVLLDPRTSVRLESGVGPVQRHAIDRGACDPATARVQDEQSPRPGVIQARVHSDTPVDVVVRVTAFPTWKVWVDGVEQRTFRVAPGFLGVRVGPGIHELYAEVSYLPHYWMGILVALIGLTVLGSPDHWWHRLRARGDQDDDGKGRSPTLRHR